MCYAWESGYLNPSLIFILILILILILIRLVGWGFGWLVGWVLHCAEATLRVLVPGFGGLVEVSLLVGVLLKASLLGV